MRDADRIRQHRPHCVGEIDTTLVFIGAHSVIGRKDIPMVEINPANLGVQAGGGAVIGFVVGYAAKKIFKLILILIGLEFALFAYLERQGIITVDWNALQDAAAISNIGGTTPPSFLQNLFSVAPLGGGFAAGAIIGWRRG